MPNESTATTLTEIVNSEWIRPSFQSYAAPWAVGSKFALEVDLRGKGSGTVALPRIQSDMGAVSDGGGGVDTEFDGAEGTDLSNTQMDLNESTVTSSEYGIMRTLTDSAQEDSIDGFQLLSVIANDAARILQTALEDDFCALFGSVTDTQGATGVDATAANLTSCIAAIRNAGVRAPGGLVAVLDDEQVLNLESDFEGTSTTTYAKYDANAATMMRLSPDANNGLTDGKVFEYKGVSVFQTGLTDTANTGADVVGCVFVNAAAPGNESWAAFAMSVSREFTSELQRDASLRATEIVCTQRKGVAIALNAAASALITDAP